MVSLWSLLLLLKGTSVGVDVAAAAAAAAAAVVVVVVVNCYAGYH